MKPGSAKKLDEHYRRDGACTALMARPLKDFRVVEAKQRRTKKDYTLFLKDLSDRHYPDAEKILLVQDNVNTHGAGEGAEIPAKELARIDVELINRETGLQR